jgi:hypothetical protein
MNRNVWTRLDTAIIVAVSITMLIVVGFTVKFDGKAGLQAAGQSSDWKCYPQAHNRGQLACFDMADTGQPIAAQSTQRLRLSGLSFAFR